MPWYVVRGAEILIRTRVQPRASHCGLALLPDGRLRLRLTAPATDGRANRQAAEILAGLFAVPKSRVSLTAGARSRDKTFLISGRAAAGPLPDPDALPAGVDRL